MAECYAPVVDVFYFWRNVQRRAVLAQYKRNFDTYTSVQKLSITKVDFTEFDGKRATATFDKEWDFRGSKDFAGNEKQQMVFLKVDGVWRIVSETELKVYWTRHGKPTIN